jgi:hypothetical protein
MIPAEVQEKPAGLIMDGVGGLARRGGNQPLPSPMRARIARRWTQNVVIPKELTIY